LSRRIGERATLSDSLADVLHASANAILLLDVSGRVRFVNQAAESILARGDGLSARGGRLLGATPRVTSNLAAVIAEAAGGLGPPRGGALPLPRPSGARPLALIAAPLGEATADAFERRPRVLVCVTDPDEAPVADAPRLRSLFGFTAAESAVAARLAAGEEVRAIADALDISHNTVRRHLQALFPKAGVSRQSELAILLTRLGMF
jgi:DNA-binding CsgD family transcriptional regulator